MTRTATAFLVSVLLGIVAGCGPSAPASSSPSPVTAAEPGWHAIAQAPLRARHGALSVWTGSEMLVLGGDAGQPCPPNADCAPRVDAVTDGAAYDPVTDEWRPIADAPVPVVAASAAVVDGVVYVWVPGFGRGDGIDAAFLGYDVADDRWQQLEVPPGAADIGVGLVAAGERLVAVRPSHELNPATDLLYDREADSWIDLPPDPLAPSFDRVGVWTGRELVLLAEPLVRDPNSAVPSLYRAASLDLGTGAWRRLPDSETVGYDPAWHWSGGRIVNPSLGSSDGGQVNNWGRAFPHGGILTPPAGAWSALPNPPDEPGGLRDLSLAGPEHVVARDGWVLHVPTGTWTELHPPNGFEGQDMSAAWAGDRLVVWGGAHWDGDDWTLLDDGWTWMP